MSAIKDVVDEAFALLDKEKLSQIRILSNGDGRKYIGSTSNALAFLNTLRKQGEAGFCDVVLEVDGQSFPAHRCVLASNSQFFYTLFTSGMRDSNEKNVNISSLSSSAVSSILDFFYTREIVVNQDNFEELLEASCFLLLNHVKHACADMISSRLSISNCFSTKRIAERYSLDELSKKAEQFMTKNFQEATKQSEFLELESHELLDLISSDLVRVEKEEEVFEAMMNWVKHDPTNRAKELSILLPCLRCGSLPSEFLVKRFEEDPIFKGIPFCESLVKQQKRQQRRSGSSEKQSVSKERPSAALHDVLIGVTRKCKYKSFCYDLQSEQFYRLPNPLSAYCQFGVTAIGQELYCQESMWDTSVGCLRKLKLGTSATHTDRNWSKIKEHPLKQSACHQKSSVLCLKGKLYILGGCMNYRSRLLHTHSSIPVYNQCFDLIKGEWKELPNMNTPRCRIGAVATSNYIYVIGGKKSHLSPATTLVERYDPETNTWSNMADVWFPRDSPHVVATSDRIFVIGGSYVREVDEFGVTNHGVHCAVYQESCDQWSPITAITPQDVFPRISFSLDDKVYTIIGKECWKYFKKSGTWRKSKRFKGLLHDAFQNGFNFVRVKLPKFCFDQYPKISASGVVYVEESSDDDDESSSSSSSSSSSDEWYDYEDENEFW